MKRQKTSYRHVMKLWVVCFVILFGSFEFYQWIRQVTWFAEFQISLPLSVVGGIVLAIASNYDLMSGLPFNLLGDGAPPSNGLNSTLPSPADTPKMMKQGNRRPISFQVFAAPKRSISFEIPQNRDRSAEN